MHANSEERSAHEEAVDDAGEKGIDDTVFVLEEIPNSVRSNFITDLKYIIIYLMSNKDPVNA